MPQTQKSWLEFYTRTDTYSVGAIGLFLLDQNPEELKDQNDKNDRRDLSLKPFFLVSDPKGTRQEQLVALIAKLVALDPSLRCPLQRAEKVFKCLSLPSL